MIARKFNVLLDTSWGSSGKGKVASTLALQYSVTDASTCNMPNAGHTVEVNGERTVYKVLPAASHFGAVSWLGPGSVIDPQRLGTEDAFGKTSAIFIHDRAGTLRPEHAERERNELSIISSTMQGSGACLAEKVMRKGKLWEGIDGVAGANFRRAYLAAVKEGVALHEIAQGWGLSLDHGTHYPHCTSRNCGVGRAMDDMAIPPQLVGDVYGVVRTFPIRVGNTADGYSGGWLPDQREVTWEEIERNTGLTGLAEKERTTVTKRVRRVATFSHSLLTDCIKHNGVTKLWVTFAEYLDAKAYKVRHWDYLPTAVREFVTEIEDYNNIEVVGVSTGPDTYDFAAA